MPLIRKVRVTGLLGQYDHEVSFPEGAPFVVLHGPNGVGKTKLLELIEGVLSGNFFRFIETPVESLQCEFDNGDLLEMVKVKAGQTLDLENDVLVDDPDAPHFLLSCESNGKREEWVPQRRLPDAIPRSRMRRIVEVELEARQIASDLWRLPDGEVAQLHDLFYRVASRRAFGSDSAFVKTPRWLENFINETKVHLIETQRLDKLSRGRHSEREGRHRRSTVSEFADDLNSRISEALAVNSRRSQQLDRSFPSRMMTDPLPEVTDDEIRELYAEQTKTREALENISILDDEQDLALPDRDLLPWERKVLWIYLQDMQMKLDTFGRILDRTRLLQEIVNSRFLGKELMIDRERGFYFRGARGHEISPEQLSSGEQHELVLMYDLLFNVKEETLVLIDEPEISLHISWQQKFLSDIERIAKLADLKFMVATHSPQIVHKWWHRTVKLGPEDKGES